MKNVISLLILSVAIPCATLAYSTSRESAQIVNAIEQESGHTLNQKQTLAVQQTYQQIVDLQNQANISRTATDPEFTYLACFGGEIAFGIKRGAALCFEKDLTRYILKSRGEGLSAGLSVKGDVVVHAGEKAKIRATYANGAPASELQQYEDYYKYSKLLGQFAGLSVDFFINTGNTDKLFFVGMDYGPYIDLSKEVLTLD